MRPAILAWIIIFSIPGSLPAQSPGRNSLQYLGQDVPALVPKVFAPGLVSLNDQYEFGSFFSKDGEEFFYAVDSGGKAEIRFMQLKNGQWSKSKKLVVGEKYSYNDPCMSPDGKKLYFISDMPLEGAGEKKDYDIWYIERRGDHWSNPLNAGKQINSEKNEYYISFSKSGTMYFSSNRGATNDSKNNYDIYASKQSKGEFQQPLRLDDSVNTKGYEADVFIAGDESYIIFCGDRQEGFGKGDLYICLKKADGTWTKAKNMGGVINTEGHELCPFVTSDGKYLFYTSNNDIYWVDARIINELR